MRKIDSLGLKLCSFQAQLFEESLSKCECSSRIFARRFLNSDLAKRMDNDGFLFEALPHLDGGVGVLSEGEAFFSLVSSRFPPDYAKRLVRVPPKEADSAVSRLSAIIYPADAPLPESDEIDRFRAENKLIPFRYALDEGSVISMARHISRIRDERQVRPGILEYD